MRGNANINLLYTFARGGAPEPYRVVVRGRCYERRVVREGYRVDRVAMALEFLYALARGGAPEPYRAVVRGRCYERRVVREGYRPDQAAMALEYL